MKQLLLFLCFSFFIQTSSWSQCPGSSNTDSDGDGVLDCIDPCTTVPSSKIGNLSFESDFIGWTIPQNTQNFIINTDTNHILHGTKSLRVTAPSASVFENHAIYSEEFILEEGIAYNFKIPVKRIGNIDGDALRWVLVDENGVYRHFNNYYSFTENWSFISFENFTVDFNNFTSNKFRLRLEFGLSTTDIIVDKIEFYETSQIEDPAYKDLNGDGIPDCTPFSATDHPDYDALASLYNSLNGQFWVENTNWLDTTKPISTWYGITETNGRVTGINLGSQNNISGTLPDELSNLTELQDFWIQNSNITGNIPTSLGNLSKLRQLVLFGTSGITGSIPNSLQNCLNLEWLYLSYNQLSGNIPDLSGLNKLSILAIDNNNFYFENLENDFNTYNNALGNNFIYSPQNLLQTAYNEVVEIGNSTTLFSGLSNNQNNYVWYRTNADGSEGGSIGTNNASTVITINSTDDYKWFYYYEATNNIVTGLTLRSDFYTIGDLPSNNPDYNALVALYNSTNGDNWNNNNNWLDNTTPLNSWHGIVLTNGRVTQLNLGGNNLTGSLPKKIGDFSELTSINLWSNQITGSIPPEIGNLSKLTYLDLAPNNFSGSIPEEIGNLTNLETLWLNQSGLSGNIPSSFTNLSKLRYLYLQSSIGPGWENNTAAYSGDFPDLTALPLELLWINNNYFKFTDIADEISTYQANIPDFKYSPQFTIDPPVETNTAIGEDITLTFTNIPSTAKEMLKKAKLVDNQYQWYKDGIALTINANSDTYIITNAQVDDSGVYHCEITNTDVPNMIIKTQPITLNIGSLSVGKNEVNKVKIYPNPANNILSIKSGNTEVKNAQLFDINGKQVLDFKLLSELTIVDISNLNSGMYLLKIKTPKTVITKRIIKR